MKYLLLFLLCTKSFAVPYLATGQGIFGAGNVASSSASPSITGNYSSGAGLITAPAFGSSAFTFSRYVGFYFDDPYGLSAYDPTINMTFGGTNRFTFEGYRGGDNEAIFRIGGSHANAATMIWNTTGLLSWTFSGSGSPIGPKIVGTAGAGMHMELSSNTGDIWNQGIYIAGSSGFDNPHYSIWNPTNHVMTITKDGDTSIGGGTREKLVTLTVQPVANHAITGTSTVNASTTVSGSGTRFLEEIGIGDGLAVSSASSTFCEVEAIASDTSLTTKCALGNGTSQTLTRKHAVELIRDKDGNIVRQTLPDGETRLTGKLVLSTSQTPASASEACRVGTVAWDSSFVYVCVATDTWKRTAIASW